MRSSHCSGFGSVRRDGKAFTLIELAVAMAVLTLILLALVGVTNQTSLIWRRTTAKVEQFREARGAFESMTTRLSQATLNTYWDYVTNSAGVPTAYTRRSELRFISGPASTVLGTSAVSSTAATHCIFFQAPFGVTTEAASNGTGLKYDGFENLLCSWGYYVNYDTDLPYRPSFLTSTIVPQRYRFRLMELWQPSEQNPIYEYTSGPLAPATSNASTYTGKDWFTQSIKATNPLQVHVLAENIIALILTPRLSPQDEATVALSGATLAPTYLYDSSPSSTIYANGLLDPVAQLPPLVQVTMVAIDETSAQRFAQQSNFGPGTSDPFKIQSEGLFQKTTNYSKDLLVQPPGTTTTNTNSLEYTLIQDKINYRIFTTNVIIRGSKWSRTQTN